MSLDGDLGNYPPSHRVTRQLGGKVTRQDEGGNNYPQVQEGKITRRARSDPDGRIPRASRAGTDRRFTSETRSDPNII